MKNFQVLLALINLVINLKKKPEQAKRPQANWKIPRQTLTSLLTQVTQSRSVVSLSWWRSRLKWHHPVLHITNPEPQDTEKEPTFREFTLFFTNRSISLGNSRNRDITVRNECVSREHIEIVEKNFKTLFISKRHYLKDRNSTNGTYKKRYWLFWQPCLKGKDYLLRHGDVFFLGHPSDPKAVRIKYIAQPPLYISAVLGLRTLLLWFLGLQIALCSLLIVNWSRIPGGDLPKFPGAPVIIYASDRRTPLKPIVKQEHKEAEKLADFPEVLVKAIIASEDSRYYSHAGIDSFGLVRASLNNLVLRRNREGGSTITQQVARTLFPDWVGRGYSLDRKLKEAAVAIKLNFSHSKEQILLAYLNSVFLGRDNNGFREASLYYFNKSFKELNLAEAATLVAMLPAPNGFDLCSNGGDGFKKLSAWRRRVITRMEKQGFIKDATQAREAKLIPLSNLFSASVCDSTQEQEPIIPRIYNSIIYRELESLMQGEAKQGNFIVETTVDVEKQKQARAIIESTIKNSGKEKGVSQAALVSIDSRTGGIVALVDAVEPQKPIYIFDQKDKTQKGPYFYDYATVEQLAPGSTFKVFAYTAALENGISPQKTYSCDRFNFESERFSPNDWPDSYCLSQKTNLDLPTAIAVSDNLTALKVAQEVGLDKVVSTAQRMGINSNLNPPVPRLVLGQRHVTLLEMTGAYGVLANHGTANKPHIINRIIDISSKKCDRLNYHKDKDCRVLYASGGDSRLGIRPEIGRNRQVLSSDVADKMTELLKGVVGNGRIPGTASNISIKGVAGKTGTSDRAKDLWFIGYIPDKLVTGVWIGNPILEKIPTQAKSKDAAQIWNDYMKGIGYSEK